MRLEEELEQEGTALFDELIVDAFSSGAIFMAASQTHKISSCTSAMRSKRGSTS